MTERITRSRGDTQSPMQRTSMNTSWTQPQGGVAAHIHEARVIDYNLATWMIDVRSQFDQKYYPNIQVGSPYMHPNRGEGIYAMPEVNAKCFVCIPSDGPPPFVMAFIMPMETPEDPAGTGATSAITQQATQQATATAGASQGAVFSGGRVRAKPGDIVMRGRDGNFVVLHRGGVLQVGATELAQRIYIPLGNIITDISQSYEHHNTGGSINWGLSTSYTDPDPETEFNHTFRLYANDDMADVRIAIGKVHQPVPEPSGGEDANNSSLGIGSGNSVICAEFVIAPGGFTTESGAPTSDTSNLSVIRMFFDDKGGGFLRAQGSINVRVGKTLRLSMGEMVVVSDGGVQLSAKNLMKIQGGSGVQISSANGATTINGGATPVAAVGSAVNVVISAPLPFVGVDSTGSAISGTITAGATLTGFVVNGCSTVLVPTPG